MHTRVTARILASSILVLGSAFPAVAQTKSPVDRPVQDLSIEELLNVEVTSVARKAQRLSDSAAAVYVLTRADIRRSGVMTVPDALRLVPGVQVARIDSNKWAVSVRGFNSRFANKLLVLVDGRSVYSPFYSGVFWETLDLPLDDVERIEVIRGPGGTMWGANAVNGVINIITTTAHEGRGTMVAGSVDSDGPGGIATVRRGWRFGDNGAIRVYARGFDRDSSAGPTPYDESDITRTGFRVDTGTPRGSWSMQGSVYSGRFGQTYLPQASMPELEAPTANDADVAGGQLSTVWSRATSSQSNVSLRVFVDHAVRSEPLVRERRSTADIEIQQQFSSRGAHDIVWGGGYRVSADDVRGAMWATFFPSATTLHWADAFVQDEWHAWRDVYLTAGAKLEGTTLGGLQMQPSLRARWSVARTHAFWAATSRAVRTPSRAESGLDVALESLPPSLEVPIPALLVVEGNRDVRAESLWAFEGGYRGRLGEQFSVDLSLFAHRYGHMLRTTPAPAGVVMGPDGPYLRVPVVGNNGGRRSSHGVEAAIEWRPVPHARVAAGYTRLNVDAPDPDDLYGLLTSGRDPRQQLVLRTQLDLRYGFEFDPTLRAVTALQDRSASGYAALDVHLGHRVSRTLDLAVNGRDLFAGRHIEMQPSVVNTVPSVVRPTVSLTATWRF